MSQNEIIPCILKLNKIITLTIDNYFINYEILKKNDIFYEYEKLQIKLHSLREQLIEGFSWYCGSTIETQKQKHALNDNEIENKNPFKHQTHLLEKAIVQNKTICKGIIANYDYKNIFTEIKHTCESQLKLINPTMGEITNIKTKRVAVLA